MRGYFIFKIFLTDTEKRNGNYDGEDIVKRWLEDVRRDAICKLRKVTYEGKKLEDAVDGIMELYDISRAGGLVALEEAAEEAESDF